MMEAYDSSIENPVDYSFKTLGKVANLSDTQWQIVYDIGNLRIFFATKENRTVRYIRLKSLDFSSEEPLVTLDVNADLSGDVTERFAGGVQK